MEFYRVLDSLPMRWRAHFIMLVATGLRDHELCELRCGNLDHEAHAIWVRDEKAPSGIRTIHVGEQFWPWAMAAVSVQVTHWYLRDHWNAAVERAGLRKVSITELQRLRRKLLDEEEEKERPMIRLLGEEAREDARLLGQVLRALILTDDEARRLLVRKVVG
jgi:hypothetical protein